MYKFFVVVFVTAMFHLTRSQNYAKSHAYLVLLSNKSQTIGRYTWEKSLIIKYLNF